MTIGFGQGVTRPGSTCITVMSVRRCGWFGWTPRMRIQCAPRCTRRGRGHSRPLCGHQPGQEHEKQPQSDCPWFRQRGSMQVNHPALKGGVVDQCSASAPGCSTKGCSRPAAREIEVRRAGAGSSLYYACEEHCREWEQRLAPEDGIRALRV